MGNAVQAVFLVLEVIGDGDARVAVPSGFRAFAILVSKEEVDHFLGGKWDTPKVTLFVPLVRCCVHEAAREKRANNRLYHDSILLVDS